MLEIILEGAVSTTLAAMNHIQDIKSKATEAGTEVRNRFFSLRTMKSFQGESEHEIRIMIEALLGMKSRVSIKNSDCFLTSDLVCFIDKLIKSTNEKQSSSDSDSRIFSTELYDTESEDIFNLDGYYEKKNKWKK